MLTVKPPVTILMELRGLSHRQTPVSAPLVLAMGMTTALGVKESWMVWDVPLPV